MDMSLSKLRELAGDGQGGLECCSPWGCKESDMTEWLNWTEEHNLYICIVCMHVQLCDAMDCSPSGSSVHEIPKGRILGLIVMPSCRDLPDPGIEPMSLKSLALAGWFFTTSSPGKPWDWATELNWRSCLTYGCWHVQNLLYVLTCSRPRMKAPTRKGWQSCYLTKAQDCGKATAIPEGYKLLSCPCPHQLAAVCSTSNWEGVEKRREDEKCPVRALLHSRDHPCTLTWPRSPLLSALTTEIPFYRGHDAVWRKS